MRTTYQYGLRIARQGGLHATGSYKTGGRSSRIFRGVYRAAMGTTVLVASMRDEGHTFHERRTPVFRLTLDYANATTPTTDRLCPQRLRN
jgi:hypothetical protein